MDHPILNDDIGNETNDIHTDEISNVFDYLQAFQNIFRNLGYDFNINHLFYWIPENLNEFEPQLLQQHQQQSNDTLHTIKEEEEEEIKDHDQHHFSTTTTTTTSTSTTTDEICNIPKFYYTLAKFLFSLITLKTKLSVLYQKKIISTISKILQKNLLIINKENSNNNSNSNDNDSNNDNGNNTTVTTTTTTTSNQSNSTTTTTSTKKINNNNNNSRFIIYNSI